MYSVSVLMSTYNGEKYIEEQIESIINQVGVKVNLLVRDDGSSDKTLAILDEYANAGKLKWYRGKNLGAAYSFMDLIREAPDEDYYAFSDQDDVWDSNKLISAVTVLEKYGQEEIVLYSCSVRVVTAELNEIVGVNEAIPVTTFADGMIHNNNQGCTMVFGKALKMLLARYNGRNLVMHDDLTMKLCLSVGGKVMKDQNCYMSYRQHGNNVIGTGESIGHSMKRRIRALFTQSCERSKQLQDIYRIYRDIIPDENREIMGKIAFYKEREFGKMQVLFDKRIVAKEKKKTRHFRIGILLGFF